MTARNLSGLQPVPRQRYVERIADQLEQFVINEELQVGDALPSERELAAQLAVSRTILRGAISMLVQKGLLEVRPGSGTYVAKPSIDFLGDSLGYLIRHDRQALIDLVEIRLMLEVETAALAAERATAEDRARLVELHRALEAAASDIEAFVEADLRCHIALAEIARNEILKRLLASLRDAMRSHIVILSHEWQDHHLKETVAYHGQIVDAISRGNSDGARRAMREHLKSVRQGLLELAEDDDQLTNGRGMESEDY